MGLITPLFLLGLLGIALPWWLHRLETQTTEREKFSTTRFLEASKRRIHVQRKLRFLLLMALRMALLALLAFAFARPVLFSEPEVAVTEDTTHHVIVMDTSFSMKEGGRFAAARQIATTIVNGMGEDDIASLYTASSRVTTIAEPGTDAADITALIATLEPDVGRLDLGEMISSLNTLIDESQANFVLHLISDYQLSGQAVRFADMIPDVINGRPVTLDIRQVTPTSIGNTMVDAVVIENRNTVVASLRTTNAAAGDRDLTVTLSINGESRDQQTVTVSGNGVVTTTFNEVEFGAGDNRVDVAFTPHDALIEDDLRYTVFDNAPPAPVLLLTDNLDSLGITYLSAALETAPRGYQVEAVDIRDFDMRVIQRYPWLIIEDIGIINGGQEAALLDYINGGGSVFAAAGPRTAGLTEMPLLKTTISAPQLSPDGRPLNLPVTRIDTTHPVLVQSSGWANVNARVYRLQLNDEDRVLVAQNAQSPVLLERNIGAGRLMLLTTSIDNSASDLPVKPVFVSFMAEAAQYLSNEKLLVKAQVADSYLQLTQTGGASGQVVDPDGNNLLSLQDTTRDQDIQLNKTGYYQVFTPGGEVLVAVNPDLRESDLTLMSAETLQNWQASVAGTAQSADNTLVVDPTSREAEPDAMEIWRIFLILLALLVLAESLLGNRYLNVKTGSL